MSLELVFKKFCIVGDLHGSLKELRACILDKKGLGIDEDDQIFIENYDNYVHHVLVGDYLDKGEDIEALIEFLYKNQEYFTIVIGNHENWNYLFLKNKLGTYKTNESLIKSFFTSADLLLNNENLKQKFFTLFDNSVPFFETKTFIVTHSPCEIKYLGQTDKVSIKNQITCRYPKQRRFEPIFILNWRIRKYFSYLKKEANIKDKCHIFGHIPVKDVYVFENKIGLDTGCVYGGPLSTLNIDLDKGTILVSDYLYKKKKRKRLYNVLPE